MYSTLLLLGLVLVALVAVIFLLLGLRGGRNAELLELDARVKDALGNNLDAVLRELGQQRQSQERSTGGVASAVQSTGTALRELQERMARVEEGAKALRDMGRTVTELHAVLQAPKLRGGQGEIWLEELLAQVLPRNRFRTQYRFRTGDVVDAAVFLRDDMILPIDSKFSLENFRKMLAAEDEAEGKRAAKAFADDVKRRIDEIAGKYVLPAEGTLGFAFMYVPAENVYYAAFVEDRGGAGLSAYAFSRKVVPVSPNSLYPYLEIVMYGLRGMEIEAGAKEIQHGLNQLQGELAKFAEEYDKVGNNLRLAQNNYDSGGKRLGKVQGQLSGISVTELPDGVNKP